MRLTKWQKRKAACNCKRCLYFWVPRQIEEKPDICPNCKSKLWNIEPQKLKCYSCGHMWKQKGNNPPAECPKCGSRHWNSTEFKELMEGEEWLDEQLRAKGIDPNSI